MPRPERQVGRGEHAEHVGRASRVSGVPDGRSTTTTARRPRGRPPAARRSPQRRPLVQLQLRIGARASTQVVSVAVVADDHQAGRQHGRRLVDAVAEEVVAVGGAGRVSNAIAVGAPSGRVTETAGEPPSSRSASTNSRAATPASAPAPAMTGDRLGQLGGQRLGRVGERVARRPAGSATTSSASAISASCPSSSGCSPARRPPAAAGSAPPRARPGDGSPGRARPPARDRPPGPPATGPAPRRRSRPRGGPPRR